MTWDKTSDREEQRRRGDALTAACLGQAGSRATREGRSGSRDGAPIWVMQEAWMPRRSDRACLCPDLSCTKHGYDRTLRGHRINGQDGADPDGFTVFGRYPKGFLAYVLKRRLLGEGVRHDGVLHVCSGTLSETERWTVDVRAQARPRVQASGTALPFRDASFRAVMLDPPYSDQYARNLYGTENPRPAWLLREAARVVVPCGRIGILHVAVPFAPPGCRLLNVYGVSTGVGFRIRAFTLYERTQEGLFHE